MFSSTQHNGVKRERMNNHLLLIQSHGLKEPIVKSPQICECACVSVSKKLTSRFKHLRTIYIVFSISSPKRGCGSGGGGGVFEETPSRPTCLVCFQLPWSLSCAEFHTLMLGGGAKKKPHRMWSPHFYFRQISFEPPADQFGEIYSNFLF